MVAGSMGFEIFWRLFGRANKTHFKELQLGMSHGSFTHTNLTICMKRLALRSFLKRDTQSGQKIMLTVSFSGERLLVLETFPKGRKFKQDYFLQSVLPALANEKRRYCRKNRSVDLFVHVDTATPRNVQELHQ
jgi:hypothetical protein